MPDADQPPPSWSTAILFAVLTSGLLVALGAVSAVLPGELRKPFLLPIAVLGIGGGFVIDRLRLPFGQRLRTPALAALLAIAPISYAMSGTTQLDAAYAEAEKDNDLIAREFLRELRSKSDGLTSGFPRWAAWRWHGTPLVKHPRAAASVYVVESLLAIAAGLLTFRPRSPSVTADLPSVRPHL